MANYSNLKAAIAAAIKQNGNQEITGQVLQDVLTSMVSVIGANYTFAGVATPATNPGTPDQNVFYLAMKGGTYTNFNGMVLPAGISLLMWNGAWTSETVMYGDGGVFDISVYKSSGGTLATYADLAAALDGGNNIPVSARKGGMSVKFVHTSDNKYAQFRFLISGSFSASQFANTDNWSFCGDDVLFENPEFIETKTDKNGKLLEARKTDGTKVEFVDFEVKGKIINEHLEENLKEQFGAKIDKITDGVNNEETLSYYKPANNPEWLDCKTDEDGKIIEGTRKDGTHVRFTKPKEFFDFFPTNKYMPIMANLKRREIVGGTGKMGDYETFTLACLTDTHADDNAVINFIDFKKKYGEYIDECFIDGDLIIDNFTHPYTHENITGYDKILLSIGNHDVYTANWHSLSDVVSEQDAYNRYFANSIENWGVTYPQGKTYYYKDYPRAKVRFVVLDCMYWDSAQKTWFTNVLGDTINSSNPAFGYHVIVAQHIPNAHSTDELLPFDCSFNSKDDISVYHCAYYDSVEVVDEFINQGGVFVTWLFGHWHADFVGTLVNYPNQMVIVQNVSSGTYSEQLGWTDAARIENTESRNQFNVYSVDTTKKYLRIARIGAEYDRNLQHKGTLLLSYDSENIRVLANY